MSGQKTADFIVRNRRAPKIIPYVGCKSGFSEIFDRLIPDRYGKKIYDVFGGGGGFTFYACGRFGSKNVIFNDHNPVIVNLLSVLKSSPQELHEQYQIHAKKSSPSYYNRVRKMDISRGTRDAGRFYYLAKNAFSGKIRFNSKNEFNCPMRKNSKSPQVSLEAVEELSRLIKDLRITNYDYARYGSVRDSFVYMDPPYMNNQNGHYNATIRLEDFVGFTRKIQDANRVMISEQNSPKELGLAGYTIHNIRLNRSLQYNTRTDSAEIIATNY